jgi:hypothetical protein
MFETFGEQSLNHLINVSGEQVEKHKAIMKRWQHLRNQARTERTLRWAGQRNPLEEKDDNSGDS